MKPFIKPRPAKPAATPVANPPPPKPQVSANELTVFAVAGAMPDAVERAAYLDRVCAGDPELRTRIEARLAERVVIPPAPPQPEFEHRPNPAPPVRVEKALLHPNVPHGDQPQGMALVPVSAVQFSGMPPAAQKQLTFAWVSATLMAVGVGALAVLFYFEKQARSKADDDIREAHSAIVSEANAREKAEATAYAAQNAADRTQQALTTANKALETERAKAATAAREVEQLKADVEKQRAAVEAAKTAATTAQNEELQRTIAEQKRMSLALADGLARVAAGQADAKQFAEAEAGARQSLELRTAGGITGWPIVEVRSLLGFAFLNRGNNAESERELAAATTEILALGKPAEPAQKAIFDTAVKHILRFYTATGRRSEAAALRAKFESLAPAP